MIGLKVVEVVVVLGVVGGNVVVVVVGGKVVVEVVVGGKVVVEVVVGGKVVVMLVVEVVVGGGLPGRLQLASASHSHRFVSVLQ